MGKIGEEQAYMKMFFLGGSLQPQLEAMEAAEEEALQEREAELNRELSDMIMDGAQQVEKALSALNAVPFGKGNADQIRALQQTVEQTKAVQAKLQTEINKQQIDIQEKIEQRELLQRKLVEMQQMLRSKLASSFPNQEALLNIGGGLSGYIGNCPSSIPQ